MCYRSVLDGECFELFRHLDFVKRLIAQSSNDARDRAVLSDWSMPRVDMFV